MSEEKGPAAVVLLRRSDGMVLGITRGDCPWAWHLPGGKQEPGESIAQTARREFFEEIGVPIPLRALVTLCEFTSASGRAMHAFQCERNGLPARFNPTAAGQPAWVPPSLLVAECMPFAAECRRILTAAGVLDGRIAEADFYKLQATRWRAAAETATAIASAAQDRLAEIEGNGLASKVGDRVLGTFLGTLEATRPDGYLVRDSGGYAMVCDAVMCVREKGEVP